MFAYIALYSYSLLILLISIIVKKTDKFTALFLFLGLLFFIGLRYASVDYFGYQWIYENIKEHGLFAGFNKELGFSLLNLIEQKTTGSFFVFIFLFSFISLYIKYSALKKITPLITLSFFVYLSTTLFWKDMGQIRNAFASGVMLYAVYYNFNKKPIKFVLSIVLAFSVHSAAIIGFIIYYINKLKNKELMYSILVISFLIGAVGGLGHIIISYLPADFLSGRAQSYIGSKYDTEKNILGLSSIANLLLMLLVVYNYNRLIEFLHINTYFIPLAVVALSMENIFTDFGIIGSRVSDILYLPSLIVLLVSLYGMSSKNSHLYKVLVVLYCFASFSYALSNAIPYQSILKLV